MREHAPARASSHRARAEQVAQALLFEGYILYPYRASALKNRSRWTFGNLFPELYGAEPSKLHVECVMRGTPDAQVRAHARFLHIARREHPSQWDEAIEREVRPGRFRIDAGEENGRAWAALEGELQVSHERIAPEAFRIIVHLVNRSPIAIDATRETAQRTAFAAAHVLLECEGGEFVSMIDPPAELREVAAACRNEGVWPVLIGSETASDTMLASPIILYDDPQVAPESPGALYDLTEIDEILSLRVLTLTDDEKREAAALDERARAVIERTEALTPAQWESMHGCFRNPPALASGMKVGSRVRIQPRSRGDVMDLALAGKVAVIEAIERDFEDRVHIAVALEDDPGRDLGLARMPGHRFFFAPDELEPEP